MDERTRDAYNEWLLKYGYRSVTFSEVYHGNMIKWVAALKLQNALTEVFNEEQNTHNYTLAKLTKEN